MATLQEIIAKRKELGAGATNVDARNALTPVAPTPVAPTPVTPTPIAPTVNVMDQMSGKTVAERQAIRSGIQAPAPAPIAPVASITPPVETPAITPTPTPVAEVKPPVTPKVEPVIDFNKSQGREQDIQSNIKQITTDNPALLKDRNAYNQAFGYDTADQGKRAMLDASFTGANTPVLMNQKDIVSALVSGVSVPEQPTQAYRNATVVANQFKKFNGMTDVQLLDNLKQGQIGTELDSLLSQNTNYAKAKAELAKAQKTASINRATQIASNVISGKETPIVDDLANIEAKYNPPLGANAQAYQDYVVKNADVVSAGSQVKQLSTQISDLTKSYNDALKSIKAQYGDMPASALLTLMGSRTSETKELLDSYINAKELAKGDFDLAMKMAEGSYEAYSKDLANQAVIDKEARDLQTQKDLLQYKSDFEKKQAQEALNDPATAIQTAIDEYKKLGIPFTSTVQSRLAEFKNSGLSLPDYLTKMRENIQQSPAYKNYERLQKGQLSDTQKMALGQQFDLQKMGMEQSFQMKLAQAKQTTDNKWTKLDDGLYTNDAGEIITADELKSAKLMNNSYISKPVGAEGGECGFYASRGTGMTATPGGNSKEARTQAFSDKTPQVGGMAFFGGAGYDKKYGHIGIVTGVNQENGTVIIKDSNYGNDKLVRERTVPASSVTGYYNNTPLAKSISGGTQAPSAGEYPDDVIAVLALAGDMTNTVEAKKTLKENGLTTQDLARFKAGTIPATANQKTQANSVVSQIDDMLTGDALSDAVGMAKTPGMFGGTERKDFEAKFASFRDNLALSNIDKLKGAMSDKDIEFLRNTASSLNLDMSEPEFIKQLNAIKTKYANIAGGVPVNKQSNTAPAYTPEAQSIEQEWLNRK